MGEIQEISLVAPMVKNLPAVQETWLWSLCWEDPLEKRMATHSSILVWRIPWTEELTVHGLTQLSDWHFHFTFTHGRDTRKLNNWIKKAETHSWNSTILGANMGFPGGSVVKNPPTYAGDLALIPGWEDSQEREKKKQNGCLGRPYK